MFSERHLKKGVINGIIVTVNKLYIYSIVGENMHKAERQNQIIQILEENTEAISGHEIAQVFNVSRQIIVKDIADMRTAGFAVRSTSRGYILDQKVGIRKVIAV